MTKINFELHLIQNFAPSCLNRDDTNSPKDCEFGGVRRARISSQAIKRSVREMFKTDPAISTGSRTKHLKDLIVKRVLCDAEPDEKQTEYIEEFIKIYFSKLDSKKTELTAVLLYLGDNELDYIAGILKEGLEQNKKFKKDKAVEAELNKMVKAADISLFGRMMAANPNLNVDAACQVAHAISTHRVDMDFDFFTAVDDLNQGEETGAGMMGNTGFNSACFYRYSLINLEQLIENLDGDSKLALDVIKAFAEASIKAIPTGKQNSFAAQNPPSLVSLLSEKRELHALWLMLLSNRFSHPEIWIWFQAQFLLWPLFMINTTRSMVTEKFSLRLSSISVIQENWVN